VINFFIHIFSHDSEQMICVCRKGRMGISHRLSRFGHH